MTDAHSHVSTRNSKFIKATPEALYRALTDPAALAVWLAPGDMTGEVHRFDNRVGGGYQMSLYYLFIEILVPILLLPLFLVGCTSTETPHTQSTSLKPTPKASAVTALPTSVSSEPKLAPVPRNCPISTPIRRLIFSELSPVIGTSPVWASWPPGPSIFRSPPRSIYPSSYEAPYGWAITKIVWEVGPNYPQSITVRGYDLSDQTPLMIQLLDNTPTVDTVLDPQHPDHPVSVIGNGWAEWGSYIVVPKAGCYTLDVSWSTGHWDITFAFGA
ncbi:MAG: SRPBCC domain-containing protein [Chloroflexota bacterium]|nr:SRPBCC domain-containing protein [Chloroflexota bacterium]